MNSTDPKVQSLLTSLSNLLKLIGTLVAGYGAVYPMASHIATYFTITSGAILVIGPAIWDVYQTIQSIRLSKAVGVEAGIKMTVQGKAVTDEGHVISQFSAMSDATPPKPVTLETADKIVKDFGPAPSTIAKS